ncbi:hypothetical protein R6Q59_015349 [Mikania micrantha]
MFTFKYFTNNFLDLQMKFIWLKFLGHVENTRNRVLRIVPNVKMSLQMLASTYILGCINLHHLYHLTESLTSNYNSLHQRNGVTYIKLQQLTSTYVNVTVSLASTYSKLHRFTFT